MAGDTPRRITELLKAIHHGDSDATQQLFAIVYDELRRIARSRLARERPDHSLRPTELVHEAYLRLTVNQEMNFENRSHFFSSAAEAMRRILIDHARRKTSAKRNGRLKKIDLTDTMLSQEPGMEQLVLLDDALTRLQNMDRQMSDVLKLRFFVGLTVQETADALSIAPRTVDRHWAAARAWLMREIQGK